MPEPESPRRARRPLWTIRNLMIVIAVVAVDSALAKALLSRPGFKRDGVAIIVVAYDVLAYSTALALLGMAKIPNTNGPFGGIGRMAAMLVYVVFVWVPILYSLATLLGIST